MERGMRTPRFLFMTMLILAFAGYVGCAASAATVSQLNANDPMTWLVKSVCTNSQDQVVAADPYDGCPAGAAIRKIKPADPLPYHNIEQEGYQQRDAFPVNDPVAGKSWVIATYDWSPFDTFNLYNGTDGYDIYSVQNGWASIVNTSDGGGYGQTFFGANCTVGGAWVLFPASGFQVGGQATLTGSDRYWEQSGQSYPGACPTSYSSILTSWKYQKQFKFGGVSGNPTKTMDTMVSYHGFKNTFNFLLNGHMEVFYFTREYGITRWEVWTPILQHPAPTTECAVPPSVQYQGVSFIVQACHDWSRVNQPLPSAAEIPIWPIPNINVLQKPHFDGDITTAWKAVGASPAGNPLYWKVANSTAPRDTQFASTGVRYLITNCAAGGDGQCGGFSEALYQDVPASRFSASATYGFGISARTEPGQGSGTIGVAVQQIAAGGTVLSTDTVLATVTPDNGTAPSTGEAASVYLSTSFISSITVINPQAAAIRFLISPQTAQTFDVLDAWLAPWPVPAGP
jgi:hypothetical protein